MRSFQAQDWSACLSFKDAVLIRNRLPDASTYQWLHVSSMLVLAENWRGSIGLFVVDGTNDTPTRRLGVKRIPLPNSGVL